jgi:hypothetical protein
MPKKGKQNKKLVAIQQTKVTELINVGVSEESIIKHLKIGRAIFFRS